MMTRTIDQFINFLVKYGVVGEYIGELNDHKHLTLGQFFNLVGEDRDMHIAGAFPWSIAPSGDTFWGQLHTEWVAMGVKEKIVLSTNTRII